MSVDGRTTQFYNDTFFLLQVFELLKNTKPTEWQSLNLDEVMTDKPVNPATTMSSEGDTSSAPPLCTRATILLHKLIPGAVYEYSEVS